MRRMFTVEDRSCSQRMPLYVNFGIARKAKLITELMKSRRGVYSLKHQKNPLPSISPIQLVVIVSLTTPSFCCCLILTSSHQLGITFPKGQRLSEEIKSSVGGKSGASLSLWQLPPQSCSAWVQNNQSMGHYSEEEIFYVCVHTMCAIHNSGSQWP